MLRFSIRLAATLAVTGATVAATATAALALPEWSPPYPKPMSITSGPSTLESVSGVKIECVSDTGSGEVVSPTTGTASIILSGCEQVLATGKLPCHTPGLAPEQIGITVPTRLGYIVHTPVTTEVGLDLGSDNLLASFVCAETKVTLKGSMIGKLTPVNKLVKAGKPFTLKFKESKGHQKPPAFEAEPPDFPEISFGGPFESAGLSSIEKIKFAEPVAVLA
jgi:hypothetical protein